MYSDHSKNQASWVNTDKLVYSVNSLGKNKDWHKKLLTNGFVDKQGSVSDLKEAIKAGHAISPAHYGGMARNTENVIKAGLLLVDVDNGWTIEQAKADPFIQQFCLLAYTSASHTSEHHKFRLIFALLNAVDALTFPWLVKELLSKFPHDPSPKSVCNAFYGNTEAIFFIENPDAVLPQEWIDDAIANAQAEKEEAERKTQERQQWLKDNPPHICSDAIPLIKCCRNEVREMIEAGVPTKSGHNDAALSVLLELLAVERYLDQIGQPYAGSARDYYDRFLVASGVDDGKAEQRWEWAEGRKNLDTSLDPEVIQNCIYAHEFKPLKTEKERKQYREDHPDFKPLNKSRSTIQRGGLGKVIPIDKNKSIGLKGEIEALSKQYLPPKELHLAIAQLSQDYGQSPATIQRIYEQFVEDLDRQDAREDAKADLQHLLNCQKDSIPLDRIFPAKLAEGINKYMGWLNLRSESAAVALLTGLSSAMPAESKILINKNLGWTESPGFCGGIVAASTQKKSPIMNTFMIRPLAKLQAKENERYEQEMSDYQAQSKEYDQLLKRNDEDSLKEKYPDGTPLKPAGKSVWFYTNATVEKVKTQMAEQPDKGILLAVDELAGLFGSMNAYRGGKGSDRQDLMSMKDGSPISVGRKSGDVFVENPLLSIFGTIQPKILQKLLGDGNDSDGFFARFCFVRQPLAATTLPELTDETFDISPMIEGLYGQISSLSATTYRLSREAYSALKTAADAYEQKRVAAGEHPIGNVYGKNGGRIGELSMLLHVIRYCFEYQTAPEEIEAETVEAAIAMVEFFTNQQRAIYAELDSQPSTLAPHLLRIVNLAKSKGDLTPRTVYKFIREMEKVKDQIPVYFQELADMGLGIIQHGRTIKFTLATDPSVGNEVGTSGDKLETIVPTSKPLQDKDLHQSGDKWRQKNKIFDSPQLAGDQGINSEMSPFVPSSTSNLDTVNDKAVPTSSPLPSPLHQNVPTSESNSDQSPESSESKPVPTDRNGTPLKVGDQVLDLAGGRKQCTVTGFREGNSVIATKNDKGRPNPINWHQCEKVDTATVNGGQTA